MAYYTSYYWVSRLCPSPTIPN